jgi:hypothetical protein
LNKDFILEQEDYLRSKIQNLSDDDKKLFYLKIENEIKDPDTYATLNWFFLSGLHHLYLKRWFKGVSNLILFIISTLLLFSENIFFGIGIGILITIFIVELSELFNSQSIVSNYNNEITNKVLNSILKKV